VEVQAVLQVDPVGQAAEVAVQMVLQWLLELLFLTKQQVVGDCKVAQVFWRNLQQVAQVA
jgi:hypothetical protein